jgi:hypothetical protein
MNWKGCGRKRSWPNLRYWPGTSLQILRETNTGQDSRSAGPRFEPRTSECKVAASQLRVFAKKKFCARSGVRCRNDVFVCEFCK